MDQIREPQILEPIEGEVALHEDVGTQTEDQGHNMQPEVEEIVALRDLSLDGQNTSFAEEDSALEQSEFTQHDSEEQQEEHNHLNVNLPDRNHVDEVVEILPRIPVEFQRNDPPPPPPAVADLDQQFHDLIIASPLWKPIFLGFVCYLNNIIFLSSFILVPIKIGRLVLSGVIHFILMTRSVPSPSSTITNATQILKFNIQHHNPHLYLSAFRIFEKQNYPYPTQLAHDHSSFSSSSSFTFAMDELSTSLVDPFVVEESSEFYEFNLLHSYTKTPMTVDRVTNKVLLMMEMSVGYICLLTMTLILFSGYILFRVNSTHYNSTNLNRNQNANDNTYPQQVPLPDHPHPAEEGHAADADAGNLLPGRLRLMRLYADVLKGIKFALFLMIEYVAIPHLIGWILDLVTLNVFNATVQHRIKFFHQNPILCIFIHFAFGLFFLIHIAIVSSEFRKLIQSHHLLQLLPHNLFTFDENLFQFITNSSLKVLFERILIKLSLVIPSIVLMVLIPTQYGHHLFPGSQKYRLDYGDVSYDVQLPLELLLFHFFLPALIRKYNHSECMRAYVWSLLIWSCDAVGLRSYLLEQEMVEEFYFYFFPPERVRFQGNIQINPLPPPEVQPLEAMVEPVAETEPQDGEGDHLDGRSADNLVEVRDADGHSEEGKEDELEAETKDDLEEVPQSLSTPEHSADQEIEEIIIHEPEEPVELDSVTIDAPEPQQQYVEDPVDHLPPPPLVQPPSRPNHLFLKSCWILLSFSLATSLLFSVVFHLPLLVGRSVMDSLRSLPPFLHSFLFVSSLTRASLQTGNDYYSLSIGYSLLLGSYFATAHVMKEANNQAELLALTRLFLKWFLVAVKTVVLGSVWLTLIPLLIGILIEAIFIIPLWTPLRESPSYSFLQAWAVGLLFLTAWIRSVLPTTPPHPHSLYRRGVVYGMVGDILWRLRFQLLILRGFERIDFTFTLFHVMVPILTTLLDHLLIPYCLARFVGLWYLDSYLQRSLIMRYSFCLYFTLRLAIQSYGYLVEKLRKLHNDIRDSRYLLGTELNNR
jgi:hypothetical protein